MTGEKLADMTHAIRLNSPTTKFRGKVKKYSPMLKMFRSNFRSLHFWKLK